MLENVLDSQLSLDALLEVVKDLKTIPNATTGMIITVTDTVTGLSMVYRSKKQAALAMSADETTFSTKRTKLFRQRYNISVSLAFWQLFSYAILGFALSEATGLFALHK
jgi:hypothetical protein